MNKLDVKSLSKSFGDEVAVRNLSISIKEGTIKTLLGPSGCGKTTTLRCIAGLEECDTGEIYIDDELVSSPEKGVHLPPKERNIGMVFQSFALWPHMTVFENVSFPLRYRERAKKADRESRTREILETVGLGQYADDLATNLSGGQQQRVALARALVTEPDLLLFDEPLSNLDAKLRRELRVEIQDICYEVNATLLYVTHSQDEALFLSDEISIMNDGNIVEENDPETIHEDPKTLFAMEFMGRSNIFVGEVGSSSDGGVEIDTPIGVLHSRPPTEFEPGEKVYVGFRPKSCEIADGDVEGGGRTNHVQGVVKTSGLTQDMKEFVVECGDEEVLVRTSGHVSFESGDQIRFELDVGDVKVFPYSEGESVGPYKADQMDAVEGDIDIDIPTETTG